MNVNLLNIRINESIKLLDSNIQKYANEFLVSPKEIENEFGLICVLENNNWWAMGLYGEFNVALYSM